MYNQQFNHIIPQNIWHHLKYILLFNIKKLNQLTLKFSLSSNFDKVVSFMVTRKGACSTPKIFIFNKIIEPLKPDTTRSKIITTIKAGW